MSLEDTFIEANFQRNFRGMLGICLMLFNWSLQQEVFLKGCDSFSAVATSNLIESRLCRQRRTCVHRLRAILQRLLT
jgi:hypothetical protein